MISERTIYLSQPKATEDDIEAVVTALRSGWIAPTGPDLVGFERDLENYLNVDHVVALNSGTAAIHLALRALGIGFGDTVLIPTVTFAATAFPVKYLGAEPVFVDVDESWNLDVASVDRAIKSLRRVGRDVSAVIPVDLYGTPANYPDLVPLLNSHGVPFIEDAAEGLGGHSALGALGSLGAAGVISFNGNKILTTSGGGILATYNSDLADTVRYWSTQSRKPVPWYEHEDIGYNYRLSNILAALGRSQLRRIDEEVTSRRQIREWYREQFQDCSGVSVQHDPTWGTSNAWLTVVRFEASRYPKAPLLIRERLAQNRIESRPTWKPLHQQPVFAGTSTFMTGAADSLFEEGLCLPSGTSITQADVKHISTLILQILSTY